MYDRLNDKSPKLHLMVYIFLKSPLFLFIGPPFLVPGPTENIAANYKAVYKISEYPSPNHPAARAVDGNFAVYSHTGHSLSPWWAMQWCDRVIVARVKIWSRTRTDCSHCSK